MPPVCPCGGCAAGAHQCVPVGAAWQELRGKTHRTPGAGGGSLSVPSPGSAVEQDCPQHYPTVAVALPTQILGKAPSKAPCPALSQGCALPKGFSLWQIPGPQSPMCPRCPCDVVCPKQEFSSIRFALLGSGGPCPEPPCTLCPPQPLCCSPNPSSCGCEEMGFVKVFAQLPFSTREKPQRTGKMTKLNTPVHKR